MKLSNNPRGKRTKVATKRRDYVDDDDSPKTMEDNTTHHSRDSHDGDFDFAYPSARALQTRRSLSKIRMPTSPRGDDDEEIIPLTGSMLSGSLDSSIRDRFVSEDACYPKARAFEMRRQHSRENLGGDNSSYSSTDYMTSGIDFLQDPSKQMTMGRKIALKLRHKKWYNPRASLQDRKYDDVEASSHRMPVFPSLQKAWAYFEHVSLTRYVVEPHNTIVEGWGWIRKFVFSFKNFDEEFERAQPGENQRPTKMYDSITTPHMQLGDFGLGFGLYFSTLRAIGYIFFLAGCISTFNIYFFASDEYAVVSDDNEEAKALSSNPLLYGSAICTNTSWELCIDCNCSDPSQAWELTNRCAVTDTNLTFIVKNNCLQQEGIMRKLGLVNYGTVMFLLLSILGLNVYLKRQQILFDEDEQTAQDYSIVISNPPPKANNPETWRRHFEENFPGVKCAAVTCAVNNDILVRALVARREVLRMMELQLDPGTPMDIDHLALLAAKHARKNSGAFKRFLAIFLPRLPELLSRLVALNTSLKGLAQLSYPCTNVFVTFEKESDQRDVLGKISVGNWHIRRNNTNVLEDKKYIFEGRLLEVSESVEPNSVRWQDLNATVGERMDQMIITSLLTFGSIIAVAYVVQFADQADPIGAAFCIAGFNLAFPELAKLFVYLEAHPTESGVQMSLYWKIATFRWVNTAIVITVITPFTHTLAVEDGLIPQIFSIFFAEIVTTNAMQLIDVSGHFQRHVLAPRASTQDTMNLCFQGLEVELAERYTNMTKIMFLAFWYSSIFPGALFMAAIALVVNYYTDRWSLMRTWKRAPHVSAEISTYSRRYFFSSACIFLAVMSSFYWSAFPFDNLCLSEDEISNETHVGVHNGTITNRFNTAFEAKPFVFDSESVVYKFCAQDFILKESGPSFPFIYREGDGEWMDGDQQWLSVLFGWTSVAVLSLVGAKFLLSLMGWIQGRFAGSYHEPGEDQGIGFHEVRNIGGYIPQVESSIFSYPLIACKCDNIGEQLFDWTDPDRDYTYYDLTKDVDHVLSGTNRRAKLSFSRVKHYPPNRVDSIKKRKRLLERRIRMSKNLFNSVAQIDGGNFSTSMHSRTASSKNENKVHQRRSGLRKPDSEGSTVLSAEAGSSTLMPVPEG